MTSSVTGGFVLALGIRLGRAAKLELNLSSRGWRSQPWRSLWLGYRDGRVWISSAASRAIASLRVAPHISSVGRKLAQNAGRSGRPKIAHRMSGKSCTQRTPAGLPSGMPGIGEVMEGAMQQAPQSGRQFTGSLKAEGEIFERTDIPICEAPITERRSGVPAFFGSAPAAISVLQNLLRLNPRETEYRVKLALLSFRQGEVETAIANLREVLAEKPDHPFALPAIARFTIETGDEASARPLLARIPAQPEILPRDQQAVLAQYRGRFGHDP